MKSNCAISIIIPVYNSERSIEKTIKSVLNQTFQPDEIIVVDDGSTDNTKQVVNKFGNAIKYIFQPNQGPGSARNTGIQNAKTEYVAFLDSDDEYKANHLEIANKYLISATTNEKWFGGAYQIVKGNTRIDRQLSHSKKTLLFARESMGFIYTSSLVIKRDYLIEAGLFPTDTNFGEDWRTWFRISLAHPNMQYSNKITVCKHITESSLTTNYSNHDVTGFFNNVQAAYHDFLEIRGKPTRQDFNMKFLKRRIYLLIKSAIIRGNKQLLIRISESFEVFSFCERIGIKLLISNFKFLNKFVVAVKAFRNR